MPPCCLDSKQTMTLDEAVNVALSACGMTRSEEAEEAGRTVATLQD